MSQIKNLTRPATIGFRGVLVSAGHLVMQWSLRRRERRALTRLDPHMLRDIGLDAQAVAEECAKPIWRD